MTPTGTSTRQKPPNADEPYRESRQSGAAQGRPERVHRDDTFGPDEHGLPFPQTDEDGASDDFEDLSGHPDRQPLRRQQAVDGVVRVAHLRDTCLRCSPCRESGCVPARLVTGMATQLAGAADDA